MNHPFDLDQKSYTLVQKLFSDIILWQTFESLIKQREEEKF